MKPNTQTTTTAMLSSQTHFSSPNSPMKIKTLIHNLLLARICRLLRSLSKLKSVLHHLYEQTRVLYLQDSELRKKMKKSKHRKKVLFGSFRLHYNWSFRLNYTSSPVSPAPPYHDPTWKTLHPNEEGDDELRSFRSFRSWSGSAKQGVVGSDGLSSYLEWLEEKGQNGINNNEDQESYDKDGNEIDKLADMFIANCHEKFRLEKIESYRRYQELLARSM